MILAQRQACISVVSGSAQLQYESYETIGCVADDNMRLVGFAVCFDDIETGVFQTLAVDRDAPPSKIRQAVTDSVLLNGRPLKRMPLEDKEAWEARARELNLPSRMLAVFELDGTYFTVLYCRPGADAAETIAELRELQKMAGLRAASTPARPGNSSLN